MILSFLKVDLLFFVNRSLKLISSFILCGILDSFCSMKWKFWG